jgi:hypothetical protein
MVRRKLLLFTLVFIFSTFSYSQNKAIVLQNLWYNDLNSYNPRSFFDDVFIVMQDKLSIKKIVEETPGPQALKADSSNQRKIKDLIDRRKASGENAYYITMESELRLPAINIGKIFFKNPPRTSKLIFNIHVYNSRGTEILADTIVNRGCISRTVDPDKGSKNFYLDYQNFLDDLQCHLKVIKEQLQQKKLPRKLYVETK